MSVALTVTSSSLANQVLQAGGCPSHVISVRNAYSNGRPGIGRLSILVKFSPRVEINCSARPNWPRS